LQAVIAHQRDHQEGHRAGGRRDHSRPAAGEGDDDCDAERRIDADLRVDAGDDREGDCLGNQRQRDDQAGEQVAADI